MAEEDRSLGPRSRSPESLQDSAGLWDGWRDLQTGNGDLRVRKKLLHNLSSEAGLLFCYRDSGGLGSDPDLTLQPFSSFQLLKVYVWLQYWR